MQRLRVRSSDSALENQTSPSKKPRFHDLISFVLNSFHTFLVLAKITIGNDSENHSRFDLVYLK